MTPEFKAALDNPDGHIVTQFLDIWGDYSYEAEISTAQEWHADNDAAAGSVWSQVAGRWERTSLDVNCSTTDSPGSIQLSHGVAVSPHVPSLFTLLGTHRYRFYVNDLHHYTWYGIRVHDGTEYRVTHDEQVQRVPFIPKANMFVDSLEVRVYKWYSLQYENSSTIVPKGTSSFSISILDDKLNLVGTAIHRSLNHDTTMGYHIEGLNATLKEGVQYYIECRGINPPLSNYQYATTNYYIDMMTYFYVGDLGGDVIWQVETSPGYGFNIGGREGYQASGSFERSFDLGGNPVDDGIFLITDLTPSDSSYVVTIYYTNDPALYAVPGIAGWTSYGAAIDGQDIIQPVTNPRYWRAHGELSASTGNDETPNISRMAIRFSDRPKVFGTYHETPDDGDSAANIGSITALHSITSAGSEMSPAMSKSIDGITKAVLVANDDAVHALINTPKGRRCRHRRGFSGIKETVTVSVGEFENILFNGLTYTVIFKDSLGISNDAKMPRDKINTVWSDTPSSFNLNEYVTYNRKKYKSLIAGNVGYQPDVSPTQWQDEGTVWVSINYIANTHLVDIAIDFLTNQLNFASHRINFQMLERVRALYPNRKIIRAKTIDSPISIKDATEQIAWLLESQWGMVEGKVALIPEPSIDAAPEFVIRESDIDINTFNFDRGRTNLKNVCIIETDFENGVAYDGAVDIDAASVVANDNNVYIHSFVDEWNMDPAEVKIRSSNFTTRNADGRRCCSFKGSLRLEQLQVGTPVSFEASSLLPKHDKQILNMFVLANNRDDSQIKTKIKLMEI